ncbi:hypothetical protein EV359DRAFT_86024 [Lentinula novae-zelandiae]|nr:hypothetical protein EV359DRAFT_86024 [Lentinula novae-zelandiae]
MSIPEQSFGDETASNVRTPEGRQPAVQEPPPVDPGMGQPQRRYTSMGYVQPASSPIGGFTYSPTWGTRGPPPGPVLQLDMESASNAGGRVSGQVATIERIQGENAEPLTVQQQEKLPERRVSPVGSEQSRASSRRLPTPPIQSLNPPPPRRGSSLSSLLRSPAMNIVNIPNYQAIQILRNANLAAAAAKIGEENNENASAIAAKNRRRRRYTMAHLLAPVELMPDQDSPVRVRSGQTVYTYMPMRHMHQLLRNQTL